MKCVALLALIVAGCICMVIMVSWVTFFLCNDIHSIQQYMPNQIVYYRSCIVMQASADRAPTLSNLQVPVLYYQLVVDPIHYGPYNPLPSRSQQFSSKNISCTLNGNQSKGRNFAVERTNVQYSNVLQEHVRLC